jgi:hypothetical protein
MYQSDRGDYRKKESLFGMFWSSCLGRLIIVAVVMGIITLIAALSCPSEQTMREQLEDDIRQCLELSDSVYMDGIDNVVANIGYMFSSAKTTGETELMKKFKKYNRLEYYNHDIFATIHVINNFHYEGERCAIGIFGMVIPTISLSDFVVRTSAIRKEYNYKPVRYNNADDFFDEADDHEEEDFIFKDMDEEDEEE